jgi:hypothetical protein
MLYSESRTYDTLSDLNQTATVDLTPVIAYVNEAYRQPLINEHVRCINTNQTTIQPITVQAHIEDTYTPGDRTEEAEQGWRAPYKRQAPRPGGYPCNSGGCGKIFDRACELK